MNDNVYHLFSSQFSNLIKLNKDVNIIYFDIIFDTAAERGYQQL